MKKILYAFMGLCLAFALASCGDDNNDPDPVPTPGPGTEISTQKVEMKLKNSEAFSTERSFDAKENWRAVSNADWCTVTPAQGTAGLKKLYVKVEENLSTEERTAIVTASAITSGAALMTITITQPGRDVVQTDDENPDAPEGMKKNAAYLVRQIKVGWNLGNTCESGIWDGYSGDVDAEGETLWGNPKTTKAMFTALKNAGFNAIRIPCRWYIHADGDMRIRQTWLDRVREIVDYAVSQDMYVILNSHHDNWYDRLPVGYDEAAILDRFDKMWTRIATAFNSYDEHLILAGTNEVIKLNADGSEDWGTPNSSDYAMMNKLNQQFINTVRATGGNNAWRCLMVQPWACSPRNAQSSAYKLPTDVVERRLIQEFHCYDPYNYCIGKDQKGNQWAQHEYTQNDLNDIVSLMRSLNNKFVEQGTPCIMAEFGSTQDNSYSKGNSAADKLRADYHKFIVSEAKKYNIPGFYWDNGAFNGDGENFGLLNRNSCTFPSRAKVALDGIMDGLK